VRGRGPDVVLIHGVLGDLRQWQRLGDSLAARHRVIAVSRRFHWPNLDPPARAGEYAITAQSEDLVTFLRSLGPPAHLIGHSYGAGVALLAALSHPELVRSLVLVEPPFATVVRDSSPEFTRELATRDSTVRALRAEVQAGDDEAAAETVMDWVQGSGAGFSNLPVDVQAIVRANARTIGPTYSVPFPRVSCDQLRALRVPVLVVRGEGTRPWFRLIADATVRCLPNAEAAVAAGGAHMALVENPAEMADRIRRFLAAH
jgi:pimeloyl-ACP methyl ester carboxylesterase